MLRHKRCRRFVTWLLILLIAAPQTVLAQITNDGGGQVFKQEELDQMLAPIALYPDSLLAQVLMASTYPLEVVQADRWAEENKELKGDALAAALENQNWDPSVKSLVQFPDVLAMMNDKIDWTQKLGDAFLSQQEDVTNTVQKLRVKAEEAGNLKTTQEQIVKVEKQVIIIEPAKPEIVYVPVYNPTIVYGIWWWPHYPPYYYYPPHYPVPTLYGFATGVAIGVAWGYAWGHWDWHHHHVNININRNIQINHRINRDRYVQHYGRGEGQWKHNPEHRKGVSYRDQKTARQFNRMAPKEAIKSRENFRGKAEAGRRDIARGDADRYKDRNLRDKSGPAGRDVMPDRGKPATRDVPSRDMQPKSRDLSRDMQPKSRDLGTGGVPKTRDRGGAFSGMDRGQPATRDFSNRGSSSRQSMSSGGGMRQRTAPSGGGGMGRGRR